MNRIGIKSEVHGSQFDPKPYVLCFSVSEYHDRTFYVLSYMVGGYREDGKNIA